MDSVTFCTHFVLEYYSLDDHDDAMVMWLMCENLIQINDRGKIIENLLFVLILIQDVQQRKILVYQSRNKQLRIDVNVEN